MNRLTGTILEKNKNSEVNWNFGLFRVREKEREIELRPVLTGETVHRVGFV